MSVQGGGGAAAAQEAAVGSSAARGSGEVADRDGGDAVAHVLAYGEGVQDGGEVASCEKGSVAGGQAYQVGRLGGLDKQGGLVLVGVEAEEEPGVTAGVGAGRAGGQTHEGFVELDAVGQVAPYGVVGGVEADAGEGGGGRHGCSGCM